MPDPPRAQGPTAVVDAIASHVPTMLLRRLTAEPESAGSAHAEVFDGALLLADISGFTVLTERLAQQGEAGAEELSGLLNRAFGPLLATIAASGGDVLKFAGDALLAVWPAAGGGLEIAARRAAACGLALQAALRRYRADEGLRLSFKVAVGAGEVAVFDVGGVLERRELLVAGEAMPGTSAALGLAEPGQVVLSPEAWALIADVSGGHSVDVDGGAVRLVRGPSEEAVAPAGIEQPEVAAGLGDTLTSYLPRAMVGPLMAGQGEWLAELRQVTVLFVNLPDLVHNATLDDAQRVMQVLQTELYRYEGSINKLSVDDKGISLVAGLGFPPLTHEDDPARGVQAAMAIHAALAALGRRASIGVTTGRAFCGAIGNLQRREYTMIGAVVNLAARLMQAADGGVLCDQATARGAVPMVAFTELKAVTLKGVAEPVPVYRPRRATSVHVVPGRPDLPLVGRTAEWELLSSELQALAAGRSEEASVVVVEGEAGVGKSRLVAELIDKARESGLVVLDGAGDAVEHSTPWYAWREVFSRLPALASARGVEARREAVLDLLGSDRDPRALLPLLNTVLALDLPESPATAELSAQGRADTTRDLLVWLLQSGTGGAPTVLVLEDAHWLDSSSWVLTLAVSRRLAPLLLVVVTRPRDQHADAPGDGVGQAAYERLVQAAGPRRLMLEGLPPADVEELVSQSLGVTAVPPQVTALIKDKAEGHPLFSEELAYALRDAGLIVVANGRCELAPGVEDLSAMRFPDTVKGVITGRIDRLTPAQQLTLKVASVIGRVFAVGILRQVHPFAEVRASLDDDLDALERADLTVLDTPEPELAYLFKHVITQEAAYDLMLFAQRRQLHQAVAEWYEHAHADDLAPFAPLLAHHWREAGSKGRAIDYLEEAGGQALRNGAYQEAIRFFTDALELDTDGLVDAQERSDAPGTATRWPTPAARRAATRRARWERQLGDAYLGLGQLAAQRAHLESALPLLGRSMPAGGRKMVTGLVWQVARQVRHRVRVTDASVHPPEKLEALREAAGVFERLNVLDFYRNHPVNALYAAIKGLNLADSAAAPTELARLSASCGLSLGYVGRRRLAEAYFARALGMVAEGADPLARAWVLHTAGLYGIGVGRWDEVTERLDEAAAIVRRLGEGRRLAEISGLSAWVASFQGDFERAEARFDDLYRFGRRNRNEQVQSWALLGQATNALRAGDLDRAEAMLSKRLAPALAATLHVRRGEWDQAHELLSSALEWAKRPAIKCYWFDLYAMTTEVAIGLWHVAHQDDDREREPVLRLAVAEALKVLHHFARVFPIAEPRALLCDGLLAWCEGREVRARRAWRRSLETAEALGMPYDQALAHYLLGLHGGGDERPQHVERAKALLTGLGVGEVGAPWTLPAAPSA